MNTCPKCGSPQASELTTSGFSLRKAMWFGCGSYVLLDEPEKVLCRTNQCFDQEEINDLRRKVEELQVALDFANEAVDQRERSRKETETELRNVKAARDYWHSKWKEACENARIKHKEVCELCT
jgi:hypothetical protein